MMGQWRQMLCASKGRIMIPVRYRKAHGCIGGNSMEHLCMYKKWVGDALRRSMYQMDLNFLHPDEIQYISTV